MNRALMVYSRSLSGAEKRFIRMAYELVNIDEDVYFVINEDVFELAQEDDEIRNKLKYLEEENKLFILMKRSNTFIEHLFNMISVIKFVKKKNIKLMHSALGAIKYAPALKIFGVRTLIEITSPDFANEIKSKRYRLYSNFMDSISCVSDNVYRMTCESLKEIGKEKLVEKTYTAKLPFFTPPQKVLKSEVSRIDKENLIVYASRFVERKNPILFAEAAKKFLEKHPQWKIVMLGKGPLEEKVLRILSDEIKNDKVKVTHTSDVYSYYRRSRVFVSVIYPDNFPSQSILEAMFMKNALIATDVGQTSQFLENDNGTLIPGYSVNSLVEALETITKDDETLEFLGNSSKQLVESKFSKDRYIEYLVNLHKKAFWKF